MGFQKKIAFIFIGLLLSLVVADVFSAYALFFYQNVFAVKRIWEPENGRSMVYSASISPAISMVKTVIARMEAKIKARKEAGLEPPQGPPYKILFNPSEQFGWVATPGSYEFVFSLPQDKLEEWLRTHQGT